MSGRPISVLNDHGSAGWCGPRYLRPSAAVPRRAASDGLVVLVTTAETSAAARPLRRTFSATAVQRCSGGDGAAVGAHELLDALIRVEVEDRQPCSSQAEPRDVAHRCAAYRAPTAWAPRADRRGMSLALAHGRFPVGSLANRRG